MIFFCLYPSVFGYRKTLPGLYLLILLVHSYEAVLAKDGLGAIAP